jgi:imidazolonepropionase-like amidohydrolase
MPEVNAHADGNEMTRPVTAHVRAADSFWPQDPALSRALAAGVTTILALPGSANLVGGQGFTVKLHPGRSAEEMRFPGAPATLKMACGENPKRVYGERRSAPSTRMGNMAGFREAFRDAVEYGARFSDWRTRHQGWQRKTGEKPPVGEAPPSPPDRDYGLETLLGVIERRVLVEVHCYRADEMLAMLALADEFGFQIRAFHHAVEAYKIRDVLAARGVGVATWADWWGFKLEAYDSVRENLALLTESGARGVLHSDSSGLVQRLNQEVAKAWSAGIRSGVQVERGAALAWVTSNAAWVLGIEEQTGSLEPGKMADVVVWSGDPLSVYSRVDNVYVDGLRLYDRGADGRRPSDFELGQGAELPNRNVEPRSLQRSHGAVVPVPVPGGAAPGQAPAGAAPGNPSNPPGGSTAPGAPPSSGALPSPPPAAAGSEVKP